MHSVRPSSTFENQTSNHDSSLLTQSSSEDSTTLPRSELAKESSYETQPFSFSSSSLSSATSISTSSLVSSSSPKRKVGITNTISTPISIDGANVSKSLQSNNHTNEDEQGRKLPSFSDIRTTPPLAHRGTENSNEQRPPSAGSGRALFSDISQPQPSLYFGDYLFPENPSLWDLRQIFFLDKTSKQKDFRQSLQLHAHLMGLMLSARISRGLDLAYDHAHDAFKNRQRPDRRNEFISTFNHTHDETERILHHALAHPQPRPSFLDMISPSSSTAVLAFLHRLRTNHSILATAFRNLQSQELDSLLLPERPPLSMSSPLRGSRDRGYSIQSGSSGHSSHQIPTNSSTIATQRHQSHQGTMQNFVNNQDIVHIILTNLFGPSSFEREHILRTEALTSIFVALLSEKKGERLMTEILERYVAQSEWQQGSRVKAKFEKTLLDIIRRGDLDLAGFSDEELSANVLPLAHHQQPLGRMASVPVIKTAAIESTPIHVHHSHHQGSIEPEELTTLPISTDPRIHIPEMTARQATVEEFYKESCLQILDMLKEFSPPYLMDLSRRIFEAIDHQIKAYASLIIIVKFFFYRFMNKCIAYPETYGMMQDTFISEKQRQRILFTTHQRLYRYVTGILNPVPGSRSLTVDPRIHEKIDAFVQLFSSPTQPKERQQHAEYTLNPVSELLTPPPVSARSSLRASFSGVKGSSTITPVLLLCPSDFTTLLYFVCPYLRTTTSSPASTATLMTRSSSFNGRSGVLTRQRTSSETPPTYSAAMKSALSTSVTEAGSGTGTGTATASFTQSSVSKLSHPPSATHKRASPSFSFFASATASLPFKAKPPPPISLPLEKTPSAPAETTFSGSSFLSLSGIKLGQAVSPRTATVEVTNTSGITAASCISSSNPKSVSNSSTKSGLSKIPRSTESIPIIRHWTDESLLPDLKTAITELKRVQPGPIKEVPWAVSNPGLTPLREPWALAYVQYTDIKYSREDPDEFERTQLRSQPQSQDNTPLESKDSESNSASIEVGLALAPPCMAMVMETSMISGGSRIVTVTKPMLVDQVMDSAGTLRSFEPNTELDLDVGESDNESLLSSEDSTLAQRQQTFLTAEDKEMSILRVNSSHMLSSADESGTKTITSVGGQSDPAGGHQSAWAEAQRSSARSKRAAADRAWKARIRHAVQSEADLPEEVQTIARSIFKILREFDIPEMDGEYDNNECYWDLQHLEGIHDRTMPSPSPHISHKSIHSLLARGIEQARHFGNHAAAIGFHHSLKILESSPVLQQLDSSKIIYLLAMPIKHRLEHRAGRARSRTMWENFAHSWHHRLVAAIERKRENLSSLRLKMYYQTCVRTSRAFEKSLGVVVSLSRLNRLALRKGLSSEELERCNGAFPDWSETDSRSGLGRHNGYTNPGCKASCCDHHLVQGVHGGESEGNAENSSRRYSSNTGQHASILRTSKIRRSSFSTYIDNMTSRSFGPPSFLESSLGHLKEKGKPPFSNSFGSQNVLWSGNTNNYAGPIGSSNDLMDIQSDFVMDARELEAVQRWVTDSGIHNFLPGEDNFLRFCMEVESIVRGIGLGGTGIQGAGIPQAQNGVLSPLLSSSGSDFFVKEVAKFNGQFVAGMAPTDQAAPITKTSSGGGVAEFLVNSFKGGHSASHVSTTTGSYSLSQAASTSNSSLSNALNNNNSSGTSSAQSPQTSASATNHLGTSRLQGRSRVLNRQALHINNQIQQDTLEFLHDNPSSIYASPPGPTYALYNPPYTTTSHGASSSFSLSGSQASGTTSGGTSATAFAHQTNHLPKDMPEFLRRVQLKLTSFVLSEWLDLFGEVEADRWFMEFLEEMESRTTKDTKGIVEVRNENIDNHTASSRIDVNHDNYFMPSNQMDVRAKLHEDQKPTSLSTTASLIDLASSQSSTSRLSLNSIMDSGPPAGSTGTSWQSAHNRKGKSPSWEANQLKALNRNINVKSSASVSTFSATQSLQDSSSHSSMLDSTSLPQQPRLSLSSSLLSSPSQEGTCGDTFAKQCQNITSLERSATVPAKSLLNVQAKKPHTPNSGTTIPCQTIAPYDLRDAYSSTMEQFNSTKSPYQKLGHLFSLELLIVASLSYPDSCVEDKRAWTEDLKSPYRNDHQQQARESRSSSSRLGTSKVGNEGQDLLGSPRTFTPGTDAIINEIEGLFRHRGPRALIQPRNLLRDMQLIATFIPGSILDLRDDGKAFWDMALAITSLKSEVVEYIVQKGTQFVEVKESSRTSHITGRDLNTQINMDEGNDFVPYDDDEERARMAEAVRLFSIGAKESHRVAQRELAILYMSLPTLPLSSSPMVGYYSPQITQNSRAPSPFSIATSSKYSKAPIPGRTSTPPLPPSPKGTFSSAFLGYKSSTASIPIKHKSRHQHSNSGSGSSFGSGVLSGLGIMTGLGSFTGSSIGSGGSTDGLNASTVSLNQHQQPSQHQQHLPSEFSEGYHNIDQYPEVQPGRHATGTGMMSQRHHLQSNMPPPPNSSEPDKFNPENVAAAIHWFTLAAAQGDKFSINYLKHRETAGGMLDSV
ncbi:hypothetical protein BX616_000004 [Lobosporangium transversale]|uniref:Uncharacterized protein n=1 Tax=Lobosporangium transversale TaxID=64571 RepID=A0A1Y2G602_9FUNG|nr:hypothetical protein BCR41DRAFT_232631 [Lobosporangium transversale]KAF9919393.1 hypothetical protein BX616_000004 [Lobosporangium transversale]ORY96082.1 hypothetical protein BCR41DRAFT_232631 [Lobosporangium transversale]|eukprot:XP_021875509.1 hypothetical protein BCR41DRAFT_232631 [Lobosporangium transversale]